MIIKAELNNYRQAPRKVRLLSALVKGKNIDTANALLNFSGKKAAGPIVKLINSAVANAVHNFKLSKDELFIKGMRVDGGVVLKRGMPRAFGRSFKINKRTSKVLLELGVKEQVTKKKVVEEKKAPKKVKKETIVKKPAVKKKAVSKAKK